ncbi:MAG: helix-turn-helix domain-containing protein [Alphaproteobacteria bacterium]
MFRDAFRGRAALQMENLALRQQVAVLRRATPKPHLRFWDRMFWVLLSRLWSHWRDALVIVKPETVIAWHRMGFKLFWRWKSRQKRAGRPPTPKEVRDLIRQMCRENPLWSAPRIHGELLKLGINVSQATVSRHMLRPRKPPSQTWRTFLDNHVDCLASMDFLVVPTAAFRLLYVLVVLSHERRRIVHFGVTEHPTSAWVAQQIREAFPWDTAPRYLIRDRDAIYGPEVRTTIKAMGIKEVITAPRSPWQNPFVERVIGSIRRDCLAQPSPHFRPPQRFQ